jgi:hypothetical protein
MVRPWYVATGNAFAMAGAFLLPLIHYVHLMPESSEMVTASPAVAAWFDRVVARSSGRATDPPPMPGCG